MERDVVQFLDDYFDELDAGNAAILCRILSVDSSIAPFSSLFLAGESQTRKVVVITLRAALYPREALGSFGCGDSDFLATGPLQTRADTRMRAIPLASDEFEFAFSLASQ